MLFMLYYKCPTCDCQWRSNSWRLVDDRCPKCGELCSYDRAYPDYKRERALMLYQDRLLHRLDVLVARLDIPRYSAGRTDIELAVTTVVERIRELNLAYNEYLIKVLSKMQQE